MGGGGGVCPPSFRQDLYSQPPGKEPIGMTNYLAAEIRKAKEIGRKMSLRKIETLSGIDLNDCPDPDPATSASPEGQRVK